MYLKRRGGKEELLSKEQLEQDFFDDALSIVQVGKKYHCNTTFVREAMKEYNIKLDPEIWYAGASLEQRQLALSGIKLTDRQRSIVIGSVLGDSSLSWKVGNRHALLSCCHCEAQKGYLAWFKQELFPFVVCDIGRSDSISPEGKQLVSYNLHTIRHPIFTVLRHIFYPEGKKIVPPNIGDMLDPLALAVWYMDDGGTKKNYSDICAQGFTREDNELLLSVLLSKFDIKGTLLKIHGGSGVLLHFDTGTGGHGRLHELIDPLLHEDLLYKKMRMPREHPKGEQHHSAKLTEEDVRSIRDLTAKGISMKELCNMFHIKVPQVHAVACGTAWKHVKDINGQEYTFPSKIWPRKGSDNASAKLNEDKVRDVRKRAVAGESCTVLASEYGVDTTVIRSVVKKQTWKHVV